MNKEISRFNIPMNDVVLMHYLKTIANLHEYVLNLILTQSSPLAFDICLEILLAVFEEKVKMLFGFGRFVEFNYVGTL